MIRTEAIKKFAAEAGFDLCGVASCRHFADSEARFRDWLARGYQSSLGYLERNLDKRFDPRRLVEGAETAVVCAVSYKNRFGEGYPDGCRTKIASYACTKDYHTTIRRMLGTLFDALRTEYPRLGGRLFCDTAPVLEKQLAVEAGLGWIGRQSLLVRPATAPTCCWANCSSRTERTPTTLLSKDRGAAAAATASTVVRQVRSSHPARSTRHAASPATPSSGNPPLRSPSTAGFSAATSA